MSENSLSECFAKLSMDTFPFQEFRSLISYLNVVTSILKNMSATRVLCMDDIVSKFPSDLIQIELPPQRIIPSLKLHQILTQRKVEDQIDTLVLVLLLQYIIFRVEECADDDALLILEEFEELKTCIFNYRKYSTRNHLKIDDVIAAFLEKLIRSVKQLSADNRKHKFHLFNIMRIMIREIGKHTVYSAVVVKLLTQEVKKHYEYVKARMDAEINKYILENFLTQLWILHDVIGRNFTSCEENEKTVLEELKRVLEDEEIWGNMSPNERYLVKNILLSVEVYLC